MLADFFVFSRLDGAGEGVFQTNREWKHAGQHGGRCTGQGTAFCHCRFPVLYCRHESSNSYSAKSLIRQGVVVLYIPHLVHIGADGPFPSPTHHKKSLNASGSSANITNEVGLPSHVCLKNDLFDPRLCRGTSRGFGTCGAGSRWSRKPSRLKCRIVHAFFLDILAVWSWQTVLSMRALHLVGGLHRTG